MTRIVAQNTRPSFLAHAGGSGHETSLCHTAAWLLWSLLSNHFHHTAARFSLASIQCVAGYIVVDIDVEKQVANGSHDS